MNIKSRTWVFPAYLCTVVAFKNMKLISKDFPFKLRSTWYFQKPHWLHFSQVLLLMVLASSICPVYSIGGSALVVRRDPSIPHLKGQSIKICWFFLYENSDLFWYDQCTKFADLRRMSVNISDITEKKRRISSGFVILCHLRTNMSAKNNKHNNQRFFSWRKWKNLTLLYT